MKGLAMARTAKLIEEDTAPVNAEGDLATGTEDWEWETVAEESPTKVVFDTIGDEFIGCYVGMQHVEQEPDAKGVDQSFDLYNFRGRDGVLYALNSSFKIVEAMKLVNPGDWVRVTYVRAIASKKGNDMKDVRVDIRKS